jgi:chromate transporter
LLVAPNSDGFDLASAEGAGGPLREVAGLFLRLGALGFGGPAAHTAMMRDEVVRRRGWIDDDEFLELLGATNLIPGPNSTELAIYLGSKRAGWRGLIVAGMCFIGPAVLIVSVLAWLYQRYGTDAAAVDLRYGILPIIIAIVANALFGLGRTSLKSGVNIVIAAAALVGYLLGVDELILLAVAGSMSALWHLRQVHHARSIRSIWLLPLAATDHARATLWRLFVVFVEIGSVLYGGGYVLLAFLQRSVVDDLGWITSQQLLDAVAVGQITPGPVFTTATFIGWQVDGLGGAAVATVGIFLPSFIFVALLGRIVPWMHSRPTAKAFIDGVTAAALGLMGGVLAQLVDTAITDALTGIIALAALAVLIRTRLNSAWLIGLGAVIGLVHLVAT